MDGDVENGDISGIHCFINSHTISEAKNTSCIYYANKGYENIPNVYEM